LAAGAIGSVALVGAPGLCEGALADDEAMRFVEDIFGRAATWSDRLHLAMPEEFPTGFTVPMDLEIDSQMSVDDHVRQVRLFAPQNPLTEVVAFRFEPGRSIPRVSTRIRLAAPQFVIAVAEMNDEALLMTKTWVAVASNGCA
jgi:sulfur-oxidizing protein SoxY